MKLRYIVYLLAGFFLLQLGKFFKEMGEIARADTSSDALDPTLFVILGLISIVGGLSVLVATLISLVRGPKR
jgi:hypothetical protein